MRKSTICFVSLLLVIEFLVSSPTVLADNCKDVTGAANVVITGPGSAVGVGQFTVGNQTYDVNYIVSFTEPTPQPDGTLTATSTHTITFSKNGKVVGEITSFDANVLTPTDTASIFNLRTEINILGGTDKFKGACGRLISINLVDFATGVATPTITGMICKCAGSREDDAD